MGAKNGAWCVGCCWALMASLFALGVMSVSWMAFIAGIIAVEKLVPWRRRVVTYATSAVLLVIGVLVLAAPDALPALTIPSDTMATGRTAHHIPLQVLGSDDVAEQPRRGQP
jgi:predicted metal-binding membrane protein